jgi:Zn-dependent protease
VLTDLFSGNISPEIAYFWIVSLLIAITFHEAAHAFVADKLGDLTPRYSGRLTLNPLAHLDPLGTILILLAGFGWGKPVPFNPVSLKNPALGSSLISLAGPAANFIIAAIFSILLRIGAEPHILWGQIAAINIMLGVFNLLPFAPLDGEKVVGGLLPPHLRAQWNSWQQMGIFFLILFIIAGGPILTQVIRIIFSFLTGQKLI